MMKCNLLTLAAGFLAVAILSGCGTSETRLGNCDIQQVIDSLSLEEKMRLVIGDNLDTKSDGGAVVGFIQKIVPGSAGSTYAVDRLGITPVVMADGPAGLRIDPTRDGDTATYYCTHFPIGTLLASTWNTGLIESMGAAIGNEVKEYGVDVLLAPAINIHRHPLCGRNFEYYAEDPLVAGKIGAAYIRGVQSVGVGTSLKHFAVNNQETNRQGVDAIVSERALREIYLRAFEIAVKEAEPWTVMSSYNYINGTYASQSHELLTQLLRDEWGYKGMVMTDWYGGKDAVAQMKAGNNLLMPGRRQQYDQLKEALQKGTLPTKVLDENVASVLQLVEKTPRFKGYKYSDKPDLKAHAQVTRQSAAEGMVLLRNEGATLPMKGVRKVALYGNCSYDFIAGGTGSGNVNRAYMVSLLDGMKNCGITLDATLQKQYSDYLPQAKKRVKQPEGSFARFLSAPLPEEMPVGTADVQAQAQANDMAVITLGRLSGEFVDRAATDFELSGRERQLVDAVSEAFHAQGKKVVVLLNIGGAVETASWRDKVDAILIGWQGGQEGGNSVADILTGKVNPSGKLTMTFPINLADHASSKNFPFEGTMTEFRLNNDDADGPRHSVKNVDYTDYAEDIYVGYRYFDTFGKDVAYPFGYGLSYTHFEYSSPKVEERDGNVKVTLAVKNTGKVAGKEVVQLYAAAPDVNTHNKPAHELRAFAKTELLAPGETAMVVLSFSSGDLASFDEAHSAWVVEGGDYRLMIGSSSRDIRLTASCKIEASQRAVSRLLQPKHKLSTLKR